MPLMIRSAILSDLFFNQDHDDCKIVEKDRFVGFDWKMLGKKADEFASQIQTLNPGISISGKQVLDDFQDRL